MAKRNVRDPWPNARLTEHLYISKMALEAIQADLTVAQLAVKYEAHPTTVAKWKKQAIDGMADTFFLCGCAVLPPGVRR